MSIDAKRFMTIILEQKSQPRNSLLQSHGTPVQTRGKQAEANSSCEMFTLQSKEAAAAAMLWAVVINANVKIWFH